MSLSWVSWPRVTAISLLRQKPPQPANTSNFCMTKSTARIDFHQSILIDGSGHQNQNPVVVPRNLISAKAYPNSEYRKRGNRCERLKYVASMFPVRDIKIGTSGYSYPGPPPKGWYGAFYPDKKTKGFDELKYYSQVFNTCEINSTFYRPPTPAITTTWATKTPDDFLFCN